MKELREETKIRDEYLSNYKHEVYETIYNYKRMVIGKFTIII